MPADIAFLMMLTLALTSTSSTVLAPARRSAHPGLGGGQCHGTGLRTSGSKLHLTVQDPNEHVLFHIRFIFLFFWLRFVQSDSVSSSYSPGIPEQKSFSAHDPSFPEMAGHLIPYCFLLCILMGRLLLPC